MSSKAHGKKPASNVARHRSNRPSKLWFVATAVAHEALKTHPPCWCEACVAYRKWTRKKP